MQEIGQDNAAGLKVYINGMPDLRQIPKEIVEAVVVALEKDISQFLTRQEHYNRD